jgi:hypothetical protein
MIWELWLKIARDERKAGGNQQRIWLSATGEILLLHHLLQLLKRGR